MRRFNSLFFIVLITWSITAVAKDHKKTYTDPHKTDADFAVQGEYVGTLDIEGEKQKWGGQVIALGNGKFRAVGYLGGLPGSGWDGKEKSESNGATKDGATRLVGDEYELIIRGDMIKVADDSGDLLGTLKKVHRKSPTLGAKPPEGSVVLFDGSTADHFEGGKLTEDGLLIRGETAKHGLTSKPKFQDFRCHVEFRLPYMPEARGQGRGNSGCYLQGRYEVQMLDSFGLEGKNNECGGIYSIAEPKVNMCYPPLTWQTYDIDFTAAKYEGDQKVNHARMTVRHNGVVVHDNQELPHATTANPVKEGPGPGPVFLQNHGNPVRYRNIWVVEKN